MNLLQEHEPEFARFPAVLRELVLAELAAGNTIEELGHSFPAALCGAYLKLAREVSTRPRVKTPDLHFYDRDCSNYSGEYTDAQRHFFVLEPAHPPKPPPDMDAIRAELEAKQRAADAARYAAQGLAPEVFDPEQFTPAERAVRMASREDTKSAVSRFKASMAIDYEKWHDGIGYDLSILREATPGELQAIEEILIQRRSNDWRDVEALAALNSKRAQAALKSALTTGDAKVRLAVHAHAPELVSERQRIDSLVQALEQAGIYTGLSEALDEVAEFHPPEIVQTLLRGLMERDGGTAVHFAALLYFIHGKAPEPFDWAQRPFFLRFNTTDLAAREQVVRELCATLGADPNRCIKPKPAKPSPTRPKAGCLPGTGATERRTDEAAKPTLAIRHSWLNGRRPCHGNPS
ncbi:MAG: hypothetical protein ACKVYV_00885 [Limisphaerales bacterium]